ncbi:MAG TPA: AMP-binding protein [Burkholderiales bacterium]|nr:AMP-binding protein [Burkholderiales bacterium]
MEPRHFGHWPPGMPRSLRAPRTTLSKMFEDSAARNPEKVAAVFEGTSISYGELRGKVESLAAHLQLACGVAPGERVLLCMQNGLDFVIAFLGILRAGAVVVPVSPMNVAAELRHYAADSDARVALTEEDLVSRFSGLPLDELLLLRQVGQRQPAHDNLKPEPDPDALCVMPYTSGSTGNPKGCMHTHATVLHSVVGAAAWKHIDDKAVALATAPFFHVTGMIHSFLATVWAGGTMVIQRRWDPLAAAGLVERHRCTHWDNVPTMVVDLLSHPGALEHDLGSMKWIFGGGAAMPEAIAQKLYEVCGVRYIEGYGMTETISQTHINPPQNPKKQCLGIPTFDTDALVVDPDRFTAMDAGEQGEIVVRGPQLLAGYWKNEKAYRDSWCEVEGETGRFFRTGDLGRADPDGYFYISDRLKRMINAAGFKVWPAEVEAAMYRHPAIKECCIIASPDARRGETVKAVVVLKDDFLGKVAAQDIEAWSRAQMAAYKVPRKIEFTDALPRTPSGKLMWRALQEREFGRKPA